VLREGARVKYESLGQITSYWVGQDKQGGYKIGASWQGAKSNPRMWPRWTYSQDAASDRRSSMYKMYIVIMIMWFTWKEKGKDQECWISPVRLIRLQDAAYCLYDWSVYFLRIQDSKYQYRRCSLQENMEHSKYFTLRTALPVCTQEDCSPQLATARQVQASKDMYTCNLTVYTAKTIYLVVLLTSAQNTIYFYKLR
jgi:hypothetical protein